MYAAGLATPLLCCRACANSSRRAWPNSGARPDFSTKPTTTCCSSTGRLRGATNFGSVVGVSMIGAFSVLSNRGGFAVLGFSAAGWSGDGKSVHGRPPRCRIHRRPANSPLVPRICCRLRRPLSSNSLRHRRRASLPRCSSLQSQCSLNFQPRGKDASATHTPSVVGRKIKSRHPARQTSLLSTSVKPCGKPSSWVSSISSWAVMVAAAGHCPDYGASHLSCEADRDGGLVVLRVRAMALVGRVLITKLQHPAVAKVGGEHQGYEPKAVENEGIATRRFGCC